MREHKFRVWDKKHHYFHWGISNICLTLGGHLMWQFGFAEPSLLSPEEAQDYELEEYTGLHDKNGKEICEGDIMRIVVDDIEVVREVEWNEDGFSLNLNDTFGPRAYWPYLGECDYEHSEVIGNIHEHPELLEDKS